jgi:hypothetical protein
VFAYRCSPFTDSKSFTPSRHRSGCLPLFQLHGKLAGLDFHQLVIYVIRLVAHQMIPIKEKKLRIHAHENRAHTRMNADKKRRDKAGKEGSPPGVLEEAWRNGRRCFLNGIDLTKKKQHNNKQLVFFVGEARLEFAL